MLHLGEEEMLRPAHAIFFSGCTAKCRFCTAAQFAFHPTYGVAVSPAQLARRIVRRQEEGAASICFIGGDPTPHIPFILQTLAELGERKRVPAVFNSNLYVTDAALDLLQGAIDIYLPDLKFGPAHDSAGDSTDGPAGCGERIGAMPGYWLVVSGAIDRLYRRGEQVIVRHLLMPGHFECCTAPVLTWLAQRPGIRLSLLDQYVPPAHVRGPLARLLPAGEAAAARTLAAELGLALVA